MVSILKLLLSIVGSLAKMAQEKQLLDAGAAKVILQGVKDADDAINRAKHARGNVDSVPIDADPFNRDNDK